ncbi:MAG: protein kinase [Byssovorax sp.]
MKICPVCSQEFPPGVTHCPDDGVALVSMNTAATGRPEELLGQIVEGRYRIERIVGKGGMGTVYACRHVVVGKVAAMKVLRPGNESGEPVLQRFIREAQTTNLLKSRHIAEITDFGQLPNGLLFVVMELLEGEDLTKAMKAGKTTRPEMIHIFTQVAETLALAHAQGIIHRDLKPDNVFLVQEGTDRRFVKLLDFGIAKVLHGESNAGLTETGVILGTPYYMSPEQARADLIDHRSDIYSLGVMMYRAFTGRLPFVADSTMGVLTRHITEAPELPSRIGNVDPATERLILRCMEKNPQNRFQSMHEVAAALRALPLTPGAPARDEPTVADRRQPSAGHPAGYATGAHAAHAAHATGAHTGPHGASGAYAPSGAYGQSGAYAPSGAYGPAAAHPVSGPSGAYAPASPSGSYPQAVSGPHAAISGPSGAYAPASAPQAAAQVYGAPPSADPRRSGQGMPAPPSHDFRASGPAVGASMPAVDPAAMGALHRSSNPSGGHPAADPALAAESSMTSLRWPPGTTARGFAATQQPPPSKGKGAVVMAIGALLMLGVGALGAYFAFAGRAPASVVSGAAGPATTAATPSSTPSNDVPAATPSSTASTASAAAPPASASADPQPVAPSASALKGRLPAGTGAAVGKPPPSATGPRKPPTEIRSPFD